ncbi:MAG: ABC transporter permease [Bacteroidales bacterium]|nr:ABC transporter permease [Bacteroidales bacterium]
MIRNYIKIAFRNLWRNKFFSLINIFGLTIGMATCIIIYLFVNDELQFGEKHKNKDRIFRILRGKEGDFSAITTARLMPLLQTKVPGIKDALRIKKGFTTISYEKKSFNENEVIYVDSNFLKFFDWELTVGNPTTVLNEANSVIISQQIAEKYFGNEYPIGKVLRVSNEVNTIITGVFKKAPKHSVIQAQIIINNEVLKVTNPSSLESWDNNSQHTYLLLFPNIDADSLAEKIPHFVKDERGWEKLGRARYKLQALPKIHLHSSEVGFDHSRRGNISIVWGFSAIAILVLLLACFNYMNLSIARSTKRAKEIGMRKTLGAFRGQIILQFLVEAIILTTLAVIFALIIVEITLPWFNVFTNNTLSVYNLPKMKMISGVLILIISISLISGFYPSFVLSKFSPIKVLKGNVLSSFDFFNKRGLQFRFRQLMLIVQLASTIGLMIGAIVINRQLHFIKNKDLGFEPNNFLVIENTWDSIMLQRFNIVKNDLLMSPNIIDVAGGYNVPGEDINNWAGYKIPNNDKELTLNGALIGVDLGYFDILKSKILKGRNFIDLGISEQDNSCIINEKAAKLLEIQDNPLGKTVSGFYDGKSRKVVGVVENIHHKSLHENVSPIVYQLGEEKYPYYFYKILIRINPEKTEETVNLINKVWNEHAPQWPIRLHFVEKQFDNMYASDKKVSLLINLFTILALIISFSGLYGLVAYVVNSRTKEIGIRRTLGAGIKQIISTIGKEFLIISIIANIFIWPVTYIIIGRWLENFSDCVTLTFWIYPLTGLIVTIIVMIIVSINTLKSVRANLVNSLKYE